MPGAVGEVGVQPVLEHLAQLMRQAQQHVAGVTGTGTRGGFHDALHLRVVQARDHGRDHDPGGDARAR